MTDPIRNRIDGANDWCATGLDCPGEPQLPALLIWHPAWGQP